MPAGTLEGDAIAHGAEAHAHQPAQSSAVDVDPRMDGRRALAEKMLHAAQVSQAFLTHHAHEQHVVFGLHAGLLHGAQGGEHHHQTAGVVTHARGEDGVASLTDGDVGALGEDGVQVPSDRHRPLTPPAMP